MISARLFVAGSQATGDGKLVHDGGLFGVSSGDRAASRKALGSEDSGLH